MVLPRPAAALALPLLLAALAGCATRTVWQRPNTAPYQIQNDVEQCWASAERARLAAAPAPPAYDVVAVPAGPGKPPSLVVPNTTPMPPDASILEERRGLADACMRQRGYTAAQ